MSDLISSVPVCVCTCVCHTQALHLAARGGVVETVNMLLNMPDIVVSPRNISGSTPLIYAAARGHTAVLEALVAAVAAGSGGLSAAVGEASADGTSALIAAAQHGHASAVAFLLGLDGVNINHAKENGLTPVYLSACNDHPHVLELLLAVEGVDVNRANNDGQTPLFKAAEHGLLEVVQNLLLSTDIDIMATDNYGYTPLMTACQGGRLMVVRALLAATATATAATAVTTLAATTATTATSIINAGASSPVNQVNLDGWSALMLASWAGREQVVGVLCQINSVDVNLISLGWTSLLLASQQGHTAVVKALLALPGILMNMRSSDGSTALHQAAGRGHIDVVRAIVTSSNPQPIHHGAVDQRGRTALFLAAENGYAEVAEVLVRLGDAHYINQVADHGFTALAVACQNNHVGAAKALLSCTHCDTGLPNNSGATPLFLAAEQGYTDLVQVLAAVPSVNVNSKNMRGWTPVIVAAHSGHTGVVAVLLASGRAMANLALSNGSTPLIMAVVERHTDIARLLAHHPSADVNYAHPKFGHTALHVASMYGRVEALRVLLAAGGCRFRLDAKGNSPPALAGGDTAAVFAEGAATCVLEPSVVCCLRLSRTLHSFCACFLPVCGTHSTAATTPQKLAQCVDSRSFSLFSAPNLSRTMPCMFPLAYTVDVSQAWTTGDISTMLSIRQPCPLQSTVCCSSSCTTMTGVTYRGKGAAPRRHWHSTVAAPCKPRTTSGSPRRCGLLSSRTFEARTLLRAPWLIDTPLNSLVTRAIICDPSILFIHYM